MITVVGMGIRQGQLTLAGDSAIKSASKVVVKTALTATYTYFVDNDIEHITLDEIFDNAPNFDDLDRAVADTLLKIGEQGDVCFCVDGSGYEDRAVALLRQTTSEIEIIVGVSRAQNYAEPSIPLTAISCYDLVSTVGWDYDTRSTLVVSDIDDEYMASQVKLILGNLIGEETQVEWKGKTIALYELDRQKEYNYDSYVKVKPMTTLDKSRFNFGDLYWIMRRLRAKDGCPWDKVQTHQSIRSNMIEEAYELVEAINNDDLDNMIEETGDVFLQAIFHCVIGEDTGEYNVQDALSGLCKKLISRHTHIFGEVKANNAEEALKAWEDAKAKEKNTDTLTSKMKKVVLPSLIRAYKIQKIAKKGGMEFESLAQVEDKIQEELREVAIAKPDDLEKELGDSLFALVNLCRWKGVEPEVALARATDKFVKRFEYVEKHSNKPMQECSAEELDKLWEEAKSED